MGVSALSPLSPPFHFSFEQKEERESARLLSRARLSNTHTMSDPSRPRATLGDVSNRAAAAAPPPAKPAAGGRAAGGAPPVPSSRGAAGGASTWGRPAASGGGGGVVKR